MEKANISQAKLRIFSITTCACLEFDMLASKIQIVFKVSERRLNKFLYSHESTYKFVRESNLEFRYDMDFIALYRIQNTL